MNYQHRTTRARIGRIAASILMLGMLAGTGVATAESASARCGSVCDDQDPLTFRIYTGPYDWYTCADDLRTIASLKQVGNGGSAQLRYSARCNTMWALADSNNAAYVERYYPNRIEWTDDFDPTADQGSRRSPMLDHYAHKIRLCLHIWAGGTSCTGYYGQINN